MNTVSKPVQVGLIAAALLLGTACDRESGGQGRTAAPVQTQEEALPVATEPAAEENSQINIGNTQYLFNVSDHSAEELQALLNRAEMIRETNAEGYDELEIVLVLHGPDINLFRQQNYSQHKPLVDLAAKLDAFEIIDMKICETTMSEMGVDRSEVPAFIDSVPYAPDEIQRLQEAGYINL